VDAGTDGVLKIAHRFRSLLFVVGAMRGAAAAELVTEWQAGLAKVAITPTEPIWMAGFGVRTHPSSGVRQDIFIRALALRDAQGKACVLTTFDLVGIDRQMADAVFAGAQRRFGLSRDRLILNVSHTHSGPVAGLEIMPMYSDLTPTQRQVVRRYTDDVIDKAIRTIGNALEALAPATLGFGQGFAGIAVNRRRVANRALPGPTDPDVPVLSVRDRKGNLRGVVVGYATHATALNDYLIGGDWPGFALEEIERAHPGATAMFIQGCGADANPLPRRDEALARIHASVLAASVEQVLASTPKTVVGPLKTAFDRVDLAFEEPPSRTLLQERLGDGNKYVRRHAERLLAELDRDGKLAASNPYPIHVWQFGPGLTFIALGGEVVADYALRLKAEHGFETKWVAGYSNDVMAYIPSARVLKVRLM